MPILNSKGKALAVALLVAVPVSVYVSDQRSQEQEGSSWESAKLFSSGTAIASASGSSSVSSKSSSASVTNSLQGGYEIAATQLKAPWSMQFSGDTVYITQRGGGIIEVNDGNSKLQELRTKKKLRVVGEAGLTGFVLDPQFAKNKYAYVYHAYEEKNQALNRIVKVKLINGVWREQKELLAGIPGGRIHEGGRLAIGPDGMLYSTSGDANQREFSQDLSSYGGKILRMTTSGAIPKDNPFKNSYVYAYGLRNSQGLAWTASGTLYASDHGPSGAPIPGGGTDTTGLDEINVIRPGGNYGWPIIQGTQSKPGLISPYYVAGSTAIAPSGIAATPDRKILVATLAGQSLKLFDPLTKKTTDILTGEGRIRDVAVHNGKIYVITNNTSGGSPGPEDDRLLILQ
ncbi:sorbosone dehydrogenase family protein [Saccharibacillus sp. JS10]|uniref:PQQ-dependent sugar dehydrogenase n=1 Tax=Saccharibacillus sp. JS10 TaxID=2950552 RepID=UPI00210BAEE4|nr:PQQ-dependent sugar dehydrogenase [Saccharibacillus sp. JS10]MCQ4088611.1 PQQ-dependent sugar dehydrogenase [Saccharibacillus sp. JS10]